jgi:8-oxo-dGTP diphosphatase
MTHIRSAEERFAWMKTMDARISSATIILEDEAGRALIVKANYKRYWTFPGGMIDAGETPKQAAIREVREEVGLTIDSDSITFAWVASRTSKMAQTLQFVFKAVLPADMLDQIKLQASEIDEWRLVSKADALSQNIHYAKVIDLWAHDFSDGYVEQTFTID